MAPGVPDTLTYKENAVSNLQFACVVNTTKHAELLGKLVTLASVSSLPFTLTPTGAKAPTSEDLGIEELRERLTLLEQQAEGPVQSQLQFKELQTPASPKRKPAKRRTAKAKKAQEECRQLAAVEIVKEDQTEHTESSVLLVRNGRSLYLTTNGFGELCGANRASFDYWMKRAHESGTVKVWRAKTPGRKVGLCAQLKPLYKFMAGQESRRLRLPALEDMQAVVNDWVAEAG